MLQMGEDEQVFYGKGALAIIRRYVYSASWPADDDGPQGRFPSFLGRDQGDKRGHNLFT
jgi:hypothetical protein